MRESFVAEEQEEEANAEMYPITSFELEDDEEVEEEEEEEVVDGGEEVV